MRQGTFFRLLITTIVASLTISCASTRIVSSWKDIHHTENLDKVLVVGLSSNEGRRRLFEDTLASQIQKNGVEAVPSHIILPTATEFEREQLEPAIESKGFDAVIVSRLVGVERERRFIPPSGFVGHHRHPHYNSFYAFYSHTYPVVYSPGYLVDDTIVSLETNLYNLEGDSDNLIWAIMSETINPDNVNREIRDISEIIVNALAKDGLI